MVTEGGINGVAERIYSVDHWRGTANSLLEKKIVLHAKNTSVVECTDH